MANTQLRSYNQLMDGTVTLAKLSSNFLQGATWSVSSNDSAVITGVKDPVNAQDVATKNYVDNHIPTVTTTFKDLTDTPNDYTAGAGKRLAINAAQDGLEYVDAPTDVTLFTGLTDTPVDYGVANQMLITDGTKLVYTNQPTPPTVITDFTGLSDTPAAYTGEAGKLLAVNSTEDAVEFITAPASIPSELEKITENGNTGWRILGRDPAKFGDIGSGAIDFSEAGQYSTSDGATGDNSFASGYSSVASGATSFASNAGKATGSGSHAVSFGTASGDNSHAEGSNTIASGYESHAEGNTTTASGNSSHAEGNHTVAQNDNMHAAGIYNIGTATDTIHETGIGTSSNKKNAFEIYTDGRLTAPELATALINTNRSLVTREYVDGSISSLAKGPDGFATTTTADYPSDYKGNGSVSEGDPFYITSTANGTLVGTQQVQNGDMLIALADNPGNTDSNWIIVQANNDYASDTTPGVIQIATQTEADAGSDNTRAITPIRLATYIQNKNLDKVAGDGLVETIAGTFDVAAADASITVGADDIKVNVASSLIVDANGVGLNSTIPDARTFTGAITISNGLDVSATTNGISLGASADLVVLTAQPTGGDPLAVATTKYVDDNTYTPNTEVWSEMPVVTDGSATLGNLAHTPVAGTERVYVNGVRQAPGASYDYTISGATITFTFALLTGDTVIVDYQY